jgi:hypothetical protein
MAENTVFLLLTALIRNFYKAIMQRIEVKKVRSKKYKSRNKIHTSFIPATTGMWLFNV